MKRTKTHIELTIKEAERIMECLQTLEAMSGAYDEHFTSDCQRAGKLADKLLDLLLKENECETKK